MPVLTTGRSVCSGGRILIGGKDICSRSLVPGIIVFRIDHRIDIKCPRASSISGLGQRQNRIGNRQVCAREVEFENTPDTSFGIDKQVVRPPQIGLVVGQRTSYRGVLSRTFGKIVPGHVHHQHQRIAGELECPFGISAIEHLEIAPVIGSDGTERSAFSREPIHQESGQRGVNMAAVNQRVGSRRRSDREIHCNRTVQNQRGGGADLGGYKGGYGIGAELKDHHPVGSQLQIGKTEPGHSAPGDQLPRTFHSNAQGSGIPGLGHQHRSCIEGEHTATRQLVDIPYIEIDHPVCRAAQHLHIGRSSTRTCNRDIAKIRHHRIKSRIELRRMGRSHIIERT